MIEYIAEMSTAAAIGTGLFTGAFIVLLLIILRKKPAVVRAGATIQFWGTNAAGTQGELTLPEYAEVVQWWVGNKHRFTEGIYTVTSVETVNGVIVIHCVEI